MVMSRLATVETRQELFDILKAKPWRIVVFDEGEVLDRYTIYFMAMSDAGDVVASDSYIVTSSFNPDSGVWLRGEYADPEHDSGQLLKMHELPEAVARQIIQELSGK